jgi:hypothetical protein
MPRAAIVTAVIDQTGESLVTTTTQYNPNVALNVRLNQAGGSKTIYALVTPETEATKAAILGNATKAGSDSARAAHLEQFRDAWTSKQDKYHEAFFDTWHEWSAPLVDLDRDQFPFAYPTAGASEPLRHLIYAYGNVSRKEGFVPEFMSSAASTKATRPTPRRPSLRSSSTIAVAGNR